MNRVVKDLKTSIHEEKEAATDYSRMAKTARKAGMKKAANLFIHIQKQEKHHKRELSKAQTEVKRQLAKIKR